MDRSRIGRIALVGLALLFAGCGGDDSDEDSAPDATTTDDDGTTDDVVASGAQLSPTDTYDEVENGARLVIGYDEAEDVFNGTVENTTAEEMEGIRIQILLSTGTTLGPIGLDVLAPGTEVAIQLSAREEPFETWSPAVEVGMPLTGGQGDDEPAGENGEDE